MIPEAIPTTAPEKQLAADAVSENRDVMGMWGNDEAIKLQERAQRLQLMVEEEKAARSAYIGDTEVVSGDISGTAPSESLFTPAESAWTKIDEESETPRAKQLADALDSLLGIIERAMERDLFTTLIASLAVEEDKTQPLCPHCGRHHS